MGNKELAGVAASPPGHRPFGVEPASAVSSEAGTPNAAAALRRCLLPIQMAFAQAECADSPVPDDAVVLHFMGSGASDQVTAGQIRAAMALPDLDALRALPADVSRLVVASRRALEASDWAGGDGERRERFRALDFAAEAFAARVPWDDQPSDSDGSPKGGDACGSVHDSAGRNGIAPDPQP